MYAECYDKLQQLRKNTWNYKMSVTAFKNQNDSTFSEDVDSTFLALSTDHEKSSALNHYEYHLNKELTDINTQIVTKDSERLLLISKKHQLDKHILHISDYMNTYHFTNQHVYDILINVGDDVIKALNPLYWLRMENITYDENNLVTSAVAENYVNGVKTDLALTIYGTTNYTSFGTLFGLNMLNGSNLAIDSSLDFTGQNTLFIVFKTPSDLSNLQVLFKSGERYILLDSGELKNYNQFGTGVTLSIDTKYIISHSIDSIGSEVFKITDSSTTTTYTNEGNTYLQSNYATIWVGSADIQSSLPLHSFFGDIATVFVISGQDSSEITGIENYLKIKYSF